MYANRRGLFLATAFSVTAAAALTGLTLSGETRETSLDRACAHTTWPAIPVQCLEGADGRAFRIVTAREPVEANSMAARFAFAFR